MTALVPLAVRLGAGRRPTARDDDGARGPRLRRHLDLRAERRSAGSAASCSARRRRRRPSWRSCRPPTWSSRGPPSCSCSSRSPRSAGPPHGWGSPGATPRLSTLRLLGVTPREVVVLTVAETAWQGLVGADARRRRLRRPPAAVDEHPVPGRRFSAAELWVGVPVLLGTLAGVPLLAAVSGAVSLRRVVVSPLGVARRQTPPRHARGAAGRRRRRGARFALVVQSGERVRRHAPRRDGGRARARPRHAEPARAVDDQRDGPCARPSRDDPRRPARGPAAARRPARRLAGGRRAGAGRVRRRRAVGRPRR